MIDFSLLFKGDYAVQKFAILFLLAVCGSVQMTPKDHETGAWQHFEYVARNIFVRCTVSGPTGERGEADFIIDTGLNRTTVSTLLAEKIRLSGTATTRAHSPAGVKVLPVMDLPSMRLANDERAHLQVVVDDLSRFSGAYRHDVDGFLGIDFFADRVLSLDFPRRLFSLDSTTEFEGTPILDQEATEFSGLLLLPVTLPNRLTMLVIMDTGADFPTDFMFYEDALYGVEFDTTHVSESGDQISAPQAVVHGIIESIRLGDLTIRQPSVTRYPAPTENPYGTRHRPGLLTCQFFEHYRSQIDFPRRRLRIYVTPELK